MDLHERNAQRVADWLASHPAVARVYYPGLKSHPGHDLAKRLMSGFGGMVTFDLCKNGVSPDDLFARLRIFRLAESLGGVESLVEQPFTMSHASMNEEARRAAGITPETIRLSIGIEDAGDLIDDLAAGLG
jgi:cystathionine beta-lyase/cystathionine gamma-synthase